MKRDGSLDAALQSMSGEKVRICTAKLNAIVAKAKIEFGLADLNLD